MNITTLNDLKHNIAVLNFTTGVSNTDKNHPELIDWDFEEMTEWELKL